MPEDHDHPERRGPFRVTFVTGVMPDKWAERWRGRESTPLQLVPVDEEHQLDGVRAGSASMALVRLPVDLTGLHRIPLYTEDMVVVVSREHPAAAYDTLEVAELADEHLLQDPDVVPQWRDVAREVRTGTRVPVPTMTLPELLASVAADAGIAVLPRSVARIHHRKDVVAVTVPDLPGRQVGLVWPLDAEDALTETFIGVVRGRTERSSRGAVTARPSRAKTPATRRSPARRRRGRP
ncbi:MAG: LysR family transcriptional regulator substrate-binding protein [Actinomycetes bacterium]